ncbi:hypothetical protein [Lysinibacillus sp. G4S2]|uniref:hypothetical protein n=1 Tax=Lysinibacillus sp. G4S2 TaxID=3055859 RepID=UPI0025A1F751|nr:hypothetical protein [Lysinibacillus sp. G4S2]MDM5247997.1 hypothetical protein [Lysinibacillus sp. G4S2]
MSLQEKAPTMLNVIVGVLALYIKNGKFYEAGETTKLGRSVAAAGGYKRRW